FHVTGVQTCALPISGARRVPQSRLPAGGRVRHGAVLNRFGHGDRTTAGHRAYSTLVMRRTLCLALAAVLISSLTACGLFSSAGAEDAARAFAAAYGDPAAAARLTDAPKAAEAALRQAKHALDAEDVQVAR